MGSLRNMARDVRDVMGDDGEEYDQVEYDESFDTGAAEKGSGMSVYQKGSEAAHSTLMIKVFITTLSTTTIHIITDYHHSNSHHDPKTKPQMVTPHHLHLLQRRLSTGLSNPPRAVRATPPGKI